MALEKISTVDKIEVVSGGFVQVRVNTSIVENDMEISKTLHRHVISPGDDYSNEPEQVQAICRLTHTPEIIETYKAAMAAQGV